MLKKQLPDHIDPFRYAELKLALDGFLYLKDMPRLSDNIIIKPDQTVLLSLSFGKDEQDLNYLKGHLEAKLTLQCQRCMEPFNYEIITDFLLGIVSTLEDANKLSEFYEPVLVKDNNLGIKDLVEDEIILNLPIIPKHSQAACKIKLPVEDTVSTNTNEKHPFRVLKPLKQK